MKQTVKIKVQFDIEVPITEALMDDEMEYGYEVANHIAESVSPEELMSLVIGGIGNNVEVINDQLDKIKGEFQLG